MLFSNECFDLYTALDRAVSAEDVTACVTDLIRMLGFNFWAFGIKPRFRPDNTGVETIDAYPPGWMTHYRASNYLVIDTSVSLAATQGTTIVWADAHSDQSAKLWKSAADIGLKVGLAHPSWNRAGALGLVSLARECSEVSQSELKLISPHLAWLSALLQVKMNSMLPPDPLTAGSLSDRELEVLRWTATGKTAGEIAVISGITMRTVNFHIANILVKLNAQNKIQAAIRGLSLGII